MPSRIIRQPLTRRLLGLGLYVWIRGKRMVRRLAEQKATTHQIALGAALGAFIAFTPTFGFQMLLAFAAATVLRCSRFAAILLSYITNPFTVVPIYLFTYRAGAWLMGQRPSMGQMRQVLTHFEQDGWSAALLKLLQFGSQIITPLWVGGVAVGVVASLIAYPVVLRLVEGHRQLAARKREARAVRQRERFRMAAGLAASGDTATDGVNMPPDAPNERQPDGQENDHVVQADAHES